MLILIYNNTNGVREGREMSINIIIQIYQDNFRCIFAKRNPSKSVCVFLCVNVCVFFARLLKNNVKFEYATVYMKIVQRNLIMDIVRSRSRSRTTFLHLSQYKLPNHITHLWHMEGSKYI